MKFKNKITGCVEEVNNKTLIEQYQKYTDVYEQVKGSNNNTLKELKKEAKTLGIKYGRNVTEEELIELIANAK